MAPASEEAKLELFLQWLKVNGAELRGCKIKYCNSSKGFGIFSSNGVPDGIFLTIPLDLAITPMRVLEDPLVGPECRSMFEEGEVDDRFLMMLFLTVERLRKNSTWKPYLDMLPTEFGNPLWYTEDELLELKGTTLHRASILQKKTLKTLFDEKVKTLAEKLLALDGNPESEVRFEDFLWANSIFWTRALNIPFPSSYVFQRTQQERDSGSNNAPGASTKHDSTEKLANREIGNSSTSQVSGSESTSQVETIWVEGLVPGIDFCNHDLKAMATWEIDESGSLTGIPFSMYLLSAGNIPLQEEKEISISYGNKGNEELLYLYGFVMKDNPDDYLMIHYPAEAISDMPFSESKLQLLEAQKGELRCLLPRSLLNNGVFPESTLSRGTDIKDSSSQCSSYSWSGKRKIPSYANKLVFPEEFLSALRTVTMKESELYQVSSLLEERCSDSLQEISKPQLLRWSLGKELVGSGGERQPSETEVRTAIWEACGDSGALQLLVDLLNMKMTELEEGSGTEESDNELLEKAQCGEVDDSKRCCTNGSVSMNRKRRASVVYRRGQKQLTRGFLREAEHALQLALSLEN